MRPLAVGDGNIGQFWNCSPVVLMSVITNKKINCYGKLCDFLRKMYFIALKQLDGWGRSIKKKKQFCFSYIKLVNPKLIVHLNLELEFPGNPPLLFHGWLCSLSTSLTSLCQVLLRSKSVKKPWESAESFAPSCSGCFSALKGSHDQNEISFILKTVQEITWHAIPCE